MDLTRKGKENTFPKLVNKETSEGNEGKENIAKNELNILNLVSHFFAFFLKLLLHFEVF